MLQRMTAFSLHIYTGTLRTAMNLCAHAMPTEKAVLPILVYLQVAVYNNVQRCTR